MSNQSKQKSLAGRCRKQACQWKTIACKDQGDCHDTKSAYYIEAAGLFEA